MTIGTPLWDDFVKKLKEVKTTVEDMGFMPKYVPNESDYESMSAVEREMTERMFRDYYCCYAKMSTDIVHNNMIVVVDKVNEEVRNLYYNNFVNLDLILNKIGDDFLKYTINMSELCNIKKIKATYLDLLVKYGITHPSNTERYEEFLCRIGLEYIYCVNLLTDSFDSRVFNEAQKKEIKRRILYSADLLMDEFGKIPTVIDLENDFKEKVESLRNEIGSYHLPKEFAEHFTAPFRGIGTGNIDYYKQLEDSLTDRAKKRSVLEYAKIAHLIYNSDKMSRLKPNSFTNWYKYFCQIVGCEHNPDYKPAKLKDTKGLEKEFYYLIK